MAIAAISTPQMTGGIGIIRISGEEAIEIAQKVFKSSKGRNISSLKGYSAAHGHIVAGGEIIDECILTLFRAPHSYTGENMVELSCHGGLFSLQRVLRAVFAAGASPAGPGEFTRIAFENGRIDLTEAEAVMNIISAHGEQGARAALNTLSGTLSKEVDEIAAELIHISAQLNAWVDYPDDEIEELENDKLLHILQQNKQKLNKLLATFDMGKAITSGVTTAIIGKPNVGKSAIMNYLSGYDRSIVTSIPGTTRDIVQDTINLGSISLNIADTAGIHQTIDEVEKIGVEKSRQQAELSELVIAVFDASRPLDENDREIIKIAKNSRHVAIINKTDLPCAINIEEIQTQLGKAVSMSAKEKTGVDTLTQALKKLLCGGEIDVSQAMLTTERQHKDIMEAASSIDGAISALQSGLTLDAVNVCIDDSIDQLLELTGKKVNDAVVDEIFASFCVGK